MAEGGVQFRLRRHELVDEGALHGLVQRRVLVHAVEDAAQLGLFGIGQIAAHHDGPCRSCRQDGEDPDLFAQLGIPPVYEVVNLAVDAGRVGQVVGDGPNGFIVVIGVKGRFEIGRSRRIHVQQKKVDGLPARIAEGIRKGEDPALQLAEVGNVAVRGGDEIGLVQYGPVGLGHGQQLDRRFAPVGRVGPGGEKGDVGAAVVHELVQFLIGALLQEDGRLLPLLGNVVDKLLVRLARFLRRHDRGEGDAQGLDGRRRRRRGRLRLSLGKVDVSRRPVAAGAAHQDGCRRRSEQAKPGFAPFHSIAPSQNDT